MKKILCALWACSAIVAGCAAPEASTEPSADRGEIVTGSNIPRKQNRLPSEVQRIDGKSSIRRCRRRSRRPTPPAWAASREAAREASKPSPSEGFRFFKMAMKSTACRTA